MDLGRIDCRRADGVFRIALTRMATWTLIDGPNFSGRSRLLGKILADAPASSRPFFLGAYADIGLSGFASTVQDELRFYRGSSQPHSTPWSGRLAAQAAQAVSTLSGGEQVMLGLTCLSAQDHTLLAGIDCALEQLDTHNRSAALGLLADLPTCQSIYMIDHRIVGDELAEARRMECRTEQDAFKLVIADAILEGIKEPDSPTIRLDGLCFRYQRDRQVFRDATITLEPGTIYRLTGDNGSGKSTLLKLLCGVLRPQLGSIKLDGKDYRPYSDGNTLMAYATQNPDEQWTSTSLSRDFEVRLASMRYPVEWADPHSTSAIARLGRLREAIGLDRAVDRHLLDYPRALRKRLSWIWPIAGFQPWLALDEPTLGQDADSVSQLGEALVSLSKVGYGIIIISHDDRLLQKMDYKVLSISQHQLSCCS